jgi:hypothetical protein
VTTDQVAELPTGISPQITKLLTEHIHTAPLD